ncbi:MAG: cobalt ECF transporter T component CbiQ [Termitinemataceae bacterium]|nr:MAG: cobalt ECF transporter T component CbiQ [Termitinemataceae bacterium]
MHLEHLEYKKDFLKGFDGRCRIIAAFFFIAVLANVKSFIILCSVIVLIIAILIRDFYITLLRLVPVNIFIITLWLPVLLGSDVHAALLYTLRINCAALLYMLFVIPMSISNIAGSLSTLRVPDKLIALLILTYRYIFLLNEKFQITLKSMRLRNQRKNSTSVWHSLGAVFTTSIVSTISRGEKIWTAMQCRGFNGSFPLTIIFKWSLRDTVLIAFSVACCAFIVIVEKL